MQLLIEALTLALVLFGVIELLRVVFASKPLAGLNIHGRKPLSCNVCATFWLTLGLFLYAWYEDGRPGLLLYAVVFAVTVILLRKFGKRSSPLPE